MLLKNQANISLQRGMPVDSISIGSASIGAETIALYYFNGSTLTLDAGQAAGVPVLGKLSVGKIQNSLGTSIANDNDSSLVVTSTALTTKVVAGNESFEAIDGVSLKDKLTKLTSGLANGEYVVDYVKGVVYGKKADTSTSVVVAYKSGVGSSSLPTLNTKSVRTTAILTTGYVAGTTITGADIYNQLILYVNFTKGSLTSGSIKIEFSDDGTNFYQESFGAISGTTSTLSLGEYTMSSGGMYRIPVSIKDKYIKVSAKGTGTVTGSDMIITAILGNQ